MCADVERVLVADRQPEASAQLVVSLEQLRAVADVEPTLVEAVAVNRLARLEPSDEAPGLIGRVPSVEVRRDEREVVAVEDVRRGRDQRRRGVVRLLVEADHTPGGIE